MGRLIRQITVCLAVVVYPAVHRAIDPDVNLHAFYVTISVFLLILMFRIDSINAKKRDR